MCSPAKWGLSCLVLHTPPPHTEIRTQNHNKQMDVHFEDFRANQHTVEVGEDDTVEGLRRKVATAMGLPEDSFCMSFGDEAMGEGADMTQLSAGDTIILTKTQKYEAIAALHALGETDITAEKLQSVEDPEVACLLLQAEVATVIPDGFLRESSLTRLDLSAVSFVTQIGDDFLEGCTSLTSIDLSGLSNVTLIGSYFLSDCESLITLDLTPLNHMTAIGSSFLHGCCSLTTLDLTPLNNLTAIGFGFLSDCNSLTTLDLTPLKNVTAIRDGFLYDCTSLATLDLTPLANVTAIGRNVLYGCCSLATLGDTHNVHKKKEYKQCFRTWCRSHVQPPRGVSRATIRHTDRPNGPHTRRRLCVAIPGTAGAARRRRRQLSWRTGLLGTNCCTRVLAA